MVVISEDESCFAKAALRAFLNTFFDQEKSIEPIESTGATSFSIPEVNDSYLLRFVINRKNQSYLSKITRIFYF